MVQNQYGEVPEYYRETEIIDYIQSRVSKNEDFCIKPE